jgi:hypothetical protein
MWALAKSGVRFRTVVNADGTKGRWRQPKLAPWECRAMIRASGGPSTRRWLPSDGRLREDGASVIGL